MQIVPKSTTNTTSMAKLDPTRSADAWAAFRLASDEHSEKRHETIMKRKRDKLEFELFTKRQHVLVEHSLLDETARIGRYKRHIGEKQLDLDHRLQRLRRCREHEVLDDGGHLCLTERLQLLAHLLARLRNPRQPLRLRQHIHHLSRREVFRPLIRAQEDRRHASVEQALTHELQHVPLHFSCSFFCSFSKGHEAEKKKFSLFFHLFFCPS